MANVVDKNYRERFSKRTKSVRQQALDTFRQYFWVIFKNVIGWVLVLAAVPLGVVSPGPFGTMVFVVGFALVTFPGKRKLTSRVMRGRGLPIEMQIFTIATAFFAIVTTCILMWFLSDYAYDLLDRLNLDLDPRRERNTYRAIGAGLMVTGLFALAATWIVVRLGLHVVNYILKGMPYLRRKVKPWLKRRGLILLPSRRKIEAGAEGGSMDEEILLIGQKQQGQLRTFYNTVFPWVRRAIGVTITILIFYYILRPIRLHWSEVKGDIYTKTSIPFFLIAAGMFAIFLFVFRVLVWRFILASFGHPIPVAPAARIWSTSEFARYLPGAIWQVVGRVYLARPYGISGSIVSITQVLELAVFLLANMLVALSCLLYFGIKNLDGTARSWLYAAAAMVPALLLLLHTKVFYGIINTVMERLKKPPITRRLRGYALVAILFWNIFGLLWQSLAIFIIVKGPLDLKWDWWWVVAGAYCLAWCAGFLAFWAPGGIGVRELVFVGVLQVILPPAVREATTALPALLGFLSVLLRLWATAGEFILASIAYSLDLRGAMGKPDAPGRIPQLSS